MSGQKYELTNLATGKKATLEARSGTIGPDCLNIGPISKDFGAFTFDPGFMSTASCSIAAIRSSSSPRSRASSRWPTC